MCCLTHDASGNHFLCGSMDGRIAVFDIDSNAIVHMFGLRDEGVPIWSLACQPKTDMVFVGSQQDHLCIVHLNSTTIRRLGHSNFTTVCCACYSDERDGVYFGDNLGNVCFMDLRVPEHVIYSAELNDVHVPWFCCHDPNGCNNAATMDQLYDIWCLGTFVLRP